ncbi:M48 family peptidase [Halonotius terrestris]|uniref:M48 family peptidase n=1 Tax=Halonotius terrestris TaxID=2487750 RepID=A0A8J8TBX1_9EURY|nr:M48 family metallopeptidase [Halonotius terrestris]TQQ79836.1 M48 family peptidase [Halonotius terrestris]
MQYPLVHVGFVLLLVGTQAVFTLLSVLNVRHADRLLDREQEWVETALGVDDLDELRGYHRLTSAFSELQSWVGLGVLLIVLYAGGLSWAVELLAATSQSVVLQGIVFFVGLAVAAQLFSIPFSVVSTFGIEEIFGFNNQTAKLFVRDTLVQLGLSVVFVAILGGAVLAFIEWLPTLWPAAAWGLFVVVSLVMQILYPRVIAPLFNDFEPVDAGELREAVEDVFERAGFATSDIYTMDASRRSSHLNAYFIGFGRTKRVVLFDTLVEKMDLPELQSVLAHELAHWKEAHIWKQFAAGVVQMAVVVAVLGWLVSFDPLYAAFGIPASATYAGLLLAGLLVGPLLQFTAPLSNKLSLAHEREADDYAAEIMGPAPMIDALGRLAGENLANPFPHPWYATFHYSHPPIPERIRRLQERGDSDVAASADSPENIAPGTD